MLVSFKIKVQIFWNCSILALHLSVGIEVADLAQVLSFWRKNSSEKNHFHDGILDEIMQKDTCLFLSNQNTHKLLEGR